MASGSGEGISFDFDINDFVKKFKLDAFHCKQRFKNIGAGRIDQLTVNNFFLHQLLYSQLEKAELEIFEKIISSI